MERKIHIVIYAILLFFMVTLAYAPDEGKEEPKEKSPMEIQLATIEKKLDDLVTGKEATAKKLDDMAKHLDKIEQLIRTRSK